MRHEDMLARLVAQEADLGCDLVALRAIVEEASELGAGRALARMGLDDPHAGRDLSELRQLLAAWRDARRSAWRAVTAWIARGALVLALIGLAYRLRLTELLR